MRLETRLRLYLGVVHLALATAVFFALREHPWWLLGSEVLFLASLLIGWQLIRGLFVPLELIETGTELIDERDFTTTFVPVGQPEMDRLIGVYNTMIVALREERLLSLEREALLSKLVEAAPSGVLVCDLDGRVERVNPMGEKLIEGIEPAMSLLDLPRPWNEALPALEPGNSRLVTLDDGRRIRCRVAELRDRGFSRRFLILEELTEELRQNEKAAYDKLVRMISHEVNNSVGAVGSLLGSLGHYTDQLADDDRDDFKEALDVGSGRLERLRAFVAAFADLVRLPAPDRRPLDLDTVVDELLTLYGPFLDEREIRIERHAMGEPPPISADRRQLEQALLNVLKNAAEAIDHGGVITVTTMVDASGRVCLWIDDDGVGLDPALTPQLYAPFMTNKPGGNGLGLTLVKEVLDRHDFSHRLEPREPKGSRFSMTC
ncbi:MAG: ATP-binding protein [Acidobacteriota bacterium]